MKSINTLVNTDKVLREMADAMRVTQDIISQQFKISLKNRLTSLLTLQEKGDREPSPVSFIRGIHIC